MRNDAPAIIFAIVLGLVAVAIVGATNPPPQSWAHLAEMLKTLGPVATAAAAWFGAFIAYKGLQKWRDEALGKRKAELAEQVLASFYRVQDVIRHARSPLVLAHEMDTEEGIPDELAKNSSYAPIRRLIREREFLSEFHSHRYAFAAVFGTKAAEPFTEITRIHNEIIHAAEDLIRYKDWRDNEGREYNRSMRRIAFAVATGSEIDPIQQRVDAAVKAIEDACRPAIEARERM